MKQLNKREGLSGFPVWGRLCCFGPVAGEQLMAELYLTATSKREEEKKIEGVPLNICARTRKPSTRFSSFKLHCKPSSEEVKAGGSSVG